MLGQAADASDIRAQQLRDAMEGALGVPFTDGNDLRPLRNGDEIFPAMLGAIEAARYSVELLTFIYWSGDIAHRFVATLSERAQAGVEVRVLLDGVGALPMPRDYIETMRNAGVDVRWFRPLSRWKLGRMGNRTHRKILVVDSETGFTGGVGIASEWEGDAQDPSHWRDSHFCCRGPCVRGLRAAFFQDWVEAEFSIGPAVATAAAAPAPGEMAVQAIASTGSSGYTDVAIMHEALALIAERRLRIVTAYFAPNDHTVATLVDAVRRGVEVEIMLPGPHIDKRVSELASADAFQPLLRAGVRIWRYQPTMLHAKVITVDGVLCCVGSANFNQRSASKDDEIALNVISRTLTAELDAHFDADLERCEKETLARWRRRGLGRRILETVLAPFKGQT
jgi:cardiolipin synthase A/B